MNLNWYTSGAGQPLVQMAFLAGAGFFCRFSGILREERGWVGRGRCVVVRRFCDSDGTSPRGWDWPWVRMSLDPDRKPIAEFVQEATWHKSESPTLIVR